MDQPTAPAAAGQQSQQPPFGSSPATGPTANRGYEAAALQRLGLVVKQLEELIPVAGATTDVGKAVLEALNKLVKLVPPGSVSPAAQKNNIEQLAMRNTQNNAQMQAVMAQRQQAQGGGAPGGAPGAPQGGAPNMQAA